MIERVEVDVHRQEIRVGHRRHVRACGEVVAHLAEPVERLLVVHPVVLVVLDRRDLGLLGQAEAVVDRIDIAVGLRVRIPSVEIRVALHAQMAVRRIARDHVGARPRRGIVADVVVRRRRRDDKGEGDRELEQEVGVGRGEMEGDRVGGAVGGDAAAQHAPGRLLEAGIRADDPGIERARAGARDAEDAAKGRDHVVDGERAPVGEAHARPEVEHPGAAVVGRRRHRIGEVGHDGVARDPACLAERHEPVIGRGEHLREAAGVVDLRVDRAKRGARRQPQRAAAMGRHERVGGGAGARDARERCQQRKKRSLQRERSRTTSAAITPGPERCKSGAYASSAARIVRPARRISRQAFGIKGWKLRKPWIVPATQRWRTSTPAARSRSA